VQRLNSLLTALTEAESAGTWERGADEEAVRADDRGADSTAPEKNSTDHEVTG
jgi:hypothetical protein